LDVFMLRLFHVSYRAKHIDIFGGVRGHEEAKLPHCGF